MASTKRYEDQIENFTDEVLDIDENKRFYVKDVENKRVLVLADKVDLNNNKKLKETSLKDNENHTIWGLEIGDKVSRKGSVNTLGKVVRRLKSLKNGQRFYLLEGESEIASPKSTELILAEKLEDNIKLIE